MADSHDVDNMSESANYMQYQGSFHRNMYYLIAPKHDKFSTSIVINASRANIKKVKKKIESALSTSFP